MRKLKVLDLFSGIGGFSLGLEATGGFETVAFCEYADFPSRVLKKHWPDVPCFPDIRQLKGSDINGPVDVICGGYPCQPFSQAGLQRGEEDPRHLWPEMARLIQELRPTWVIGENVTGHIKLGLDQVLSDLEDQGYSARAFAIPAVSVNAPHKRERIWTVAHSNGSGLQGRQEAGNPESQRQGEDQHTERRPNLSGAIWEPEPNVGRVANGVPNRVDRLKCLGNAVVPQVVQKIGEGILKAHWSDTNDSQ